MANLYGTSNPLPIWTFNFASGDTACPAGVETNFLALTIAAVSGGFFYPVVIGSCTLSIGATAPSGGFVNARIGAGADYANTGIPTVLLTANNNFTLPLVFAGNASQSIWIPPGATVNLSCTPTGQAVTVRGSSSSAYLFLYRAPDQ